LTPDYAQNAAFHDALAKQYDSRLESNRYNRLARTAFHDIVAAHVAPGSTLLDFGCGTGIDALHYARQGFRVLAYDNSAGMVGQLERRCAAEIASGQVQSCAFDYGRFPASLPAWPAPQAIVANFAVLNSIRDVAALFASFSRLLPPAGVVIVSVLNPIHWSKVRMSAWWTNALPHPRGPRLIARQPCETYLHFVPALRQAAPDFELVGRANAGAQVRFDGRDSRRWNAGGLLWATPAYKLLGHFVFLVWRRR